MKKLILLSLLSCSLNVLSQTVPNIDELNVPNSPAFVFLDESPANIEKPTNPKAVALNLINFWEGNGAIEFTPYWLYNHPTYTFNQDVANKTPFWQTFALSAATSKKGDSTYVSGGFRVQLFRQYTDEADILASKAQIALELLNNPIKEAAIKDILKQMNEKRSKIKWNIELAGAFSGIGTSKTDLNSNKIGAWLNVRHTPTGFPVDLVALFRYSSSTDKTELNKDTSVFDYGISLSKQGETFDLQFEYVKRRDMTLDEDYDRMAFIANYQIMPGIVAVASLGKNFENVDNIFTSLGVKFGLSKQKVN